MSIFLRPITTRMFLFMYLLGILSSLLTIPPYKTAHMYEWAPYELFADVYLITIFWLIVKKVLYRNTGKRKLDKALNVTYHLLLGLFYIATYSLYIVDTFCFVKFGSALNPSMLLIIGETTGNEASEFLQSYVTPDIVFSEVGLIALVPILHVLSTIPLITRKINLKITIPYPKIASMIVAIAVGVCIYLTYPNKKMYAHTMSLNTIGEVEHSLAYRPHTETYQPPMRLAFSIRCNELIAQQLDRLKETVGKVEVEVDSCSGKSPEIVLIIGESFNKRHAQLYGYDKPNMPNQVRMEREGRLTKFEDVVSPWNLTSFVFKLFMTTYCIGDKGEWCDYPLFCEIFRKAGYHVNFITNQFQTKAKQEVYDFSGGFFINNEELSKVQFDTRNNRLHVFDEGLLRDYDAIADSQKSQSITKRLHIFHLMGMHVNYRIRCPNRMKKWGVGEYPNDSDIPIKRRKVLADYDNSVWYNDSVVNQIVERFKNDEAIIIYIPDHGEEVFGPGARHFFGRMHDAMVNKRLADEEFRIPMWIYTTPMYAEKHPDVVEAIHEAAPKKYMTDALSHMLMGLAGIQTPYYKPQYDLLSPEYNETRPRLLKNKTDYDTLK